MSKRTLFITVMVIAAGFTGYLIGRQATMDHGAPAGSKQDRKVLYYHDPMVPGARFDRPGKSPFMDMQLVPVYEDEAGADGAVNIARGVQQQLAMRTVFVKQEAMTNRVEAAGYVFDTSPLASNASPARLRILAEMDATDAQFVRPGVAAQIRLNGSESVRRGVVERIESDPALRTIRVRIRLLDDDAALRANRAATVIIDGPGNKRLAVPREALIRTATRTAVIRVRTDGGFEPVSVTIGREFGELIEIRSGLKDGDRIVTSGQFLLDSEANLRSGLDRLAPAAETAQ
jgi:hypothetical protein